MCEIICLYPDTDRTETEGQDKKRTDVYIYGLSSAEDEGVLEEYSESNPSISLTTIFAPANSVYLDADCTVAKLLPS